MEAESPARKRRKLTKDEIEHPLTDSEAELGTPQHAHTTSVPKSDTSVYIPSLLPPSSPPPPSLCSLSGADQGVAPEDFELLSVLGTGGMVPMCSGCVVGHRRYGTYV